MGTGPTSAPKCSTSGTVLLTSATHMDLYDGKGVDIAMSKLAPFFARTV
ncbi:Uncharacterized protein ToN1_07440 [Aromatoleum petrolei]|nr:Uncharacterized protein ToN1_07440 [Aromatoleum petrolei]